MTASSPPFDWSVVVPVRNEAGNIAPLIAEIHTAMRNRGAYEIIYVDDGSSDETAAELRAAVATDGPLRVLRHERSCGQSQALITGIAAARGEWIVTLDGDGQNDPADIATLAAARDAAGGEADRTLFMGRRAVRRDGMVRRLASGFANAVRGTLLGDRTSDSGCGIKLLRRDLYMALPRFDAMHRFMPALVIRAGGRVVSLSVNHRPRLHGQSKYGIWKRAAVGVVDLLGVFWLMRRYTAPAIELPPGERAPH